VAHVRTQCSPEAKKDGKSGSNGRSEDNGYDLRGRLWIIAEDVVNLRFGCVTERCLGKGKRYVRVARYGKVKDLLLERCGRTECADDDGGGNWLRGCEELVGQILLCLQSLAWSDGPKQAPLTKETFALPLSFTLNTKDSSSPLVGSVKVRKAWCGRFAVCPSSVVRSSFSESVAPRDTDLASGFVALSLQEVSHEY
jgi:hypothetical protein